MKRLLVTGAAGHLGEAIMRRAAGAGWDALGLDIRPSPFVRRQGTLTDADFVQEAVSGADAVIHAATLHKPQVATHSRRDFVDVNVAGTLNLLEAATACGGAPVIFTSTTSAFGATLRPAPGDPAVWIDEDAPSDPKNIYGATKTAAEDLCRLFHRSQGLPIIILRTSRFFPEPDDDPEKRAAYPDTNLKSNELLFRRLDVEDAADGHFLALKKAAAIGFGRYILTADSPFERADLPELRRDAPSVVDRRAPGWREVYAAAGYRMFPSIERVYRNDRARRDLGWRPKHSFASALAQIAAGAPVGSELARQIGVKGYHGEAYADGLYPVGPDG